MYSITIPVACCKNHFYRLLLNYVVEIFRILLRYPSIPLECSPEGTVAFRSDIAIPSASVDSVDGEALYGKFIEIGKSDYISGAFADVLGFGSSDSDAYILNQIFNIDGI